MAERSKTCKISDNISKMLHKKAQELSVQLVEIEKMLPILDRNGISAIRKVSEMLARYINASFGVFRAPLYQLMDILETMRKECSDEIFEDVLDAILEPFATIIMDIEGQWRTIRKIVCCLTRFLKTLPEIVTSEIVLKHANQLQILRKCLDTSGEYRNQRVVMLFLFQCSRGMSHSEKKRFIQMVFPKERLLHFRRCFVTANVERLEMCVRTCLNEYNDLQKKREIISFEVQELNLGAFKSLGLQMEKIWIDFNSYPRNISIYCSSNLLFKNLAGDRLVLIYIPIKIIRGFVLDRNNFYEELFIMAIEKFTIVDVLSGDVNDFLDIRDLRCTFFIPERQRDAGKATLDKIKCLVDEKNSSIKKKEPFTDLSNHLPRLETTTAVQKMIPEAQPQIFPEVLTQPMDISTCISPILPEPPVNDDSGVFIDNGKSVVQQMMPEKIPRQEDQENIYQGAEFRGFCAIDESSSDEEPVLEFPGPKTPPPVVKVEPKAKRGVIKSRPVKVEKRKRPAKCPTVDQVKVNKILKGIRGMSEERAKVQENQKKKIPVVRQRVKRRRLESSDEEEQEIFRLNEDIKRFKDQREILAGQADESINLLSDHETRTIPKEATIVETIDLEEEISQSQKIPDVETEMKSRPEESKTLTGGEVVERKISDDGLLISSDGSDGNKSPEVFSNRSFIISSDEETSKMMKIVKAVVHHEEITRGEYSRCRENNSADDEKLSQRKDNDFFNLSSIVSGEPPPMAEKLKIEEKQDSSVFTVPKNPPAPPKTKRDIWLDKPIWKGNAPKKSRMAKKLQKIDEDDVFEFNDYNSSTIPDISASIDRFLKRQENEEEEKEGRAMKSTDVFDQLAKDKPETPVTKKRRLYNPQRIVEEESQSQERSQSQENRQKYKFFKSRNSTSPSVVVDSDLSDHSDKEAMAVARLEKIKKNIEKIRKKTKKKGGKPKEEVAAKKRGRKPKAPFVKRSLMGSKIEAGVLLANITPSGSSVFIKKIGIENYREE